MTAQNLMLIYCGLLLLILLLGFLGGVIHGRRKATYKLITTLIFYGFFFVIIDKVALSMVDFPILTKLTEMGVVLPPQLQGYASIKDLCAGYLLQAGLTSDEILNVLMSFAIIVTKIAFTLVYFIVIGLLYCFIVNLIYLAFFRRKGARLRKLKKNIESKEKDSVHKTKKIKLKEHRLTGGCLGLLKKVPQVIVVIAVTTGIVSLIPTIKPESNEKVNLTTNIESNELMDIVKKYNLQEYVNFIEMYRNSPFVKVLGGDEGNKRISGYIFDKLTSGVYKDYKLDLQSEMAFMISTGAKAFGILDGNFDINSLTVTQQKEMCALLNELTKSELIMNLLPIGANVALSLQVVKDAIATNAPGLNLDPSLLNDINWETDIKNISDTAIALVELSNGFQNLNKLDYLKLNPVHVKTLMSCISNVTILMNIIPVVVDYAIALPQVQAQIGDVSNIIKDIIWKDELNNVGDIYEKLSAIGLSSFNNILGELTAPIIPGEVDKLEKTQELVSTIFTSKFVSAVFPVVMNKVISGQSEQIKQLFGDLRISEWDHELNTIIDIARDVRDNGGTLTKLDLSIVRDVNIDTILKSELLTQGFTRIFTTYDNAGSIGSQIGLSNYIYVPEEYRNGEDKIGGTVTDNKWFKKAKKVENADGSVDYIVEEHRELASILTAFQKLLPKEGTIDFNKLPEYILQIPDNYLCDENDPNRGKEGYFSIFDSKVLRASLSNMVMTNNTIKDLIIIPKTAAPTLVDNKVNVIKVDELNNMIKGIKALGITNFTNIQPNYEMIANLKKPYNSGINNETTTKTNLDVILSSDIVYSTFSNLIIDMESKSNGMFSVPQDVLTPVDTFNETNGKKQNINLQEFHNVIDAILVFDTLDFTNPKFDISMITNLNDNEISDISKSSILRNTITNFLKDFDAKDTIVVPVSSLCEYNYLSKAELESMLKGVKILPTDLFNGNPNIDIDSLIKSLNNPLDPNDVNSPKNIDIALNSNILHATISKYLIQAETTSNGIMLIPTDVKEKSEKRLASLVDTTIVQTESIKINKVELKDIVNAITVLPINFSQPNVSIDTLLDIYYDVNNTIKTFNELKGDNNIEILIKSKIINTTVTKALTEYSVDKQTQKPLIYIPDDGSTINLENGYYYINPNELKNVIKGFIALGLTDPNNKDPQGNFKIDINIVKTLEEKFENTNKTKVDFVLESNIVRTTISQLINDITKSSNGKFRLPLITDKLNKHYTVDKIKLLNNTDVAYNITKQELKNVIHAFIVLGLDLNNGFTNFDPNIIFNLDSKIPELVASNIINLVIAENIVEVSKTSSSLVLPLSTFNKEKGLDNLTNYTFIDPIELQNLVKAFNALLKVDNNTPIDLNNIKISTDIIKKLTDDAKLNTVLSSKIAHATISDALIKAVKTSNGTLIIPPSVLTNDIEKVDNTLFKNITEDEIKNLIKALTYFTISLEGSTNVDAGGLFSLLDSVNSGEIATPNNSKLRIVLNSKILDATISSKLLQVTALKIDDIFKINDSVDPKIQYLEFNELYNLIKSLRALLGINGSFDNITVTPDALINKTNEQLNEVFDSTILRSTLASSIGSSLTLPNDVIQKEVNGKKLTLITLTKEEAVNLFVAFRDGLKLSNSSSNGSSNDSSNKSPFDTGITTTFDPALITDINRLNALYGSRIIKHKLTTTILGVKNLLFVDDASLTVFETLNDHTYLKNEEITALLQFANGTDLNNLDLDNIMKAIATDPNLKAKLKSSMILRATIGNMVDNKLIGSTQFHPFKETDFIFKLNAHSSNGPTEIKCFSDSFFTK